MSLTEFSSFVAGIFDGDAIQVASTAITAIATVVLGYATWVLARETKVLSRATSQAHVTVTIEPNAWAINYVDIVVSNSGNAPAYDIDTTFDPPLPSHEEGPRHRRSKDVPLKHISLLRPEQFMQSNLCEFEKVSQKTYRVTITWRHHPKAKTRETLSYDLSMGDYHDVSYLGARSPLTQIAEQMKKLREDWQYVARGQKRIKTDVYSDLDRKRAHAELDAVYAKMKGDTASDSDDT